MANKYLSQWYARYINYQSLCFVIFRNKNIYVRCHVCLANYDRLELAILCLAAADECVGLIHYLSFSDQTTTVLSWGTQMTMVVHQRENAIQYVSVSSVSQKGSFHEM